ncbi:helix-turn-helix domain-containing protein [Pseudoalteromonas xiamenensis]
MQSPEEYEVTLRIHTIIKELKAKRGYTKKKISELLGIGLTTLDDHLNGTSSFRLGTLIKFAQISRTRLGDILEGTKEFDQELKKDTHHEEEIEPIHQENP